jgi:hypothetical protein
MYIINGTGHGHERHGHGYMELKYLGILTFYEKNPAENEA